VRVENFALAMFALYEIVNKLHRTRTIKSHHSHNVFKDSRFKLAQVTFHAGRLQLEHTGRIAALE
jgi:hypothetical protein